MSIGQEKKYKRRILTSNRRDRPTGRKIWLRTYLLIKEDIKNTREESGRQTEEIDLQGEG